jgi:hypothetical protein
VLIEVLGEQEGAFLGAGRAEVEPPTVKRAEIFETAFGV